MIKISQHLNRDDADVFLDSLASKMWEFLNQKRTDGSYRVNSLKSKLDLLITKSSTRSFFIDVSLGDHETLARQKSILNYLKNNDYQKLKACVISKPNELFDLKQEILTLINEDDLYTENGGNVTLTSFGNELIDNLFNYKNYRSNTFCVNLLERAGFDNITCPYCNDNFISIVDISDEEFEEDNLIRAYLELDHFYPKSRIPFFALSFYNLIPSCSSCNASEKRDKNFCINTHINPYLESFNETYKFFVNPYPLGLGEKPVIEIRKVSVKHDLSVRDFKLVPRYNHKYSEEVLKLISRYQKYIAKVDFYNDLDMDWEEALLQNVPDNENQILTKSGGKMYWDIARQIDEIGKLSIS